ncbi:hypothetical protein SLA2020_263520 [Shorea laevis]
MERACFPFPLLMALLMLQFYLATLVIATVPNITTDQSALLALKAQISYDPRNVLTNNWSTSTSVCNWIGITCGFRHHRVTTLDLSYIGLVVTLGYNNFGGAIPREIGNLQNLELFNIGGNHFIGLIPFEIFNISTIREIAMPFNNLSGHIPSNVGLFLPNLQHLYLERNKLSGTIPSSISNASQLTELALNATHSRDQFLNHLGIIPRGIGNLSNLIILSLRTNELAGPIPTTVGRLNKLQALRLDYNRLNGPISSDLCHLGRLQPIICHDSLELVEPYRYLEVNLSSNFLSGLLSFEIGNLKVLRVLELSRNQLSGDIPITIGGLNSLANLSLADNRLDGSIPKSFGDLVSLQFLDLSNNNLSGEIPKSLEALSHLKYLNVSFNRLRGNIPTGGPFVNFSAASFMSNDGLCGAPRLQVPQCKEGVSRPKKTARTYILMYVLPTIGLTVLVVSLLLVWTRRQKKNTEIPMEENSLPLATWRRISQQELLQATEGFCANSLLGKGSFGSVYRGTLSDGMIVAIKVFNLTVEGAFKSFDIECGVLRNIRHRNLVKIISTCSNMDFKAFVLEYMPNGNLEKWLYSHNGCLNILQRLNIMIDVASALEYLHYSYSTPIVHCDLKPSNILLDEDMVAHVVDFGIAKLLGDEDSMMRTMTLATIGYMAPEYGSEGLVSTKGDVYSYGILLMETFTRRKPTDDMFAGEMSLKRWVEESSPLSITKVVDADLMRNERDYASTEDCISSIMELALHCCAELPAERVSAKNISITLNKIKLKFLQDTEGS